LALIRKNFSLRGLPVQALHAPFTHLPADRHSVDVVCIDATQSGLPDGADLVREVYRILKPGGKVLAVVPAYYDVPFWQNVFFPWERWLRRSVPNARPRYVRRDLLRLFPQFVEHTICHRHLRRGELPHLWRWQPLFLLERIMGRFLVLKAFKPLSAAMPTILAA
jgi:SAM-dependent methyltransferase